MQRIICRIADERVTEQLVTEYLLQPVDCTSGGMWVPVGEIEPADLEPESHAKIFGDAEPEQEHCDRCNDTGWIAVRNSYPMSYVGPGPCPDYATGVCDAPCDRCDRGYENRRRRMA